MTMIDPVPALRDLCGGAVALPGDDGYDAARSLIGPHRQPRTTELAATRDYAYRDQGLGSYQPMAEPPMNVELIRKARKPRRDEGENRDET